MASQNKRSFTVPSSSGSSLREAVPNIAREVRTILQSFSDGSRFGELEDHFSRFVQRDEGSSSELSGNDMSAGSRLKSTSST